MILPDVNVLVYAHRPEGPHHDRVRNWLLGALAGPDPVAVCDPVLSGFLRIVTHPRIFSDPTPLPLAWSFCEAVRQAPAARAVRPGSAHWSIFRDLLTEANCTGNDVPDAYLAAIAIEHGATMITADRGFSRFTDLSFRSP